MTGDLFMKRGATYGVPQERVRYELMREWDQGPRVCYIGNNPSTADDEVDDPTSIAWVQLARANGAGGYVAVNKYPLRAAIPSDCFYMMRAPERYGMTPASIVDVTARNLQVITAAIARSHIIVACWGAIARDVPGDEGIVDYIVGHLARNRRPLRCIGVTAAGDPIHPMARGKMRVRRDQQFQVWRAP